MINNQVPYLLNRLNKERFMIKLRAFSLLPFILLSFYNSAFADTNLNNKLQEMTDNARKKFHVSALSMSIITPKQEQILSFL